MGKANANSLGVNLSFLGFILGYSLSWLSFFFLAALKEMKTHPILPYFSLGFFTTLKCNWVFYNESIRIVPKGALFRSVKQ